MAEGAAGGAALLGGVAGGVFADPQQAAADTPNRGKTIEPVAEWVEPYREAPRALSRAVSGAQVSR